MGRKSSRISPELWGNITYVVGEINLHWFYITRVLVVDFEQFYGCNHLVHFFGQW